MQALHAADLDHVRARALDVCAERVQEVRQIDDMRLLCAVLSMMVWPFARTAASMMFMVAPTVTTSK